MDGEIKREDAIYLAGLMDGEGSFYIQLGHGKSGCRVVASVGVTNKEFMETIHAMIPWVGRFGGGKVVKQGNRSNPRHRDAWRIFWSGSTAFKICAAIKPYIILKKRHVDIMMEILEARQKAKEDRIGVKYPSWYHELVEKLHAEIMILNKRGK